MLSWEPAAPAGTAESGSIAIVATTDGGCEQPDRACDRPTALRRDVVHAAWNRVHSGELASIIASAVVTKPQ